MKDLPDLMTLQGARELVIDMNSFTRSFYEQNGRHPLVCHLLATRPPPPSFFTFTRCAPFEIVSGKVALITIMAEQVGCESDKDRFALVVRLMSRIVDAVGTIMIFEGWYATTPAESLKEAQAWRDTLPENLEDYPDRKEAIAVMLEHAKGSISWHAFITRQGERGILGDFEECVTKIQGRFGDTLGKQSGD